MTVAELAEGARLKLVNERTSIGESLGSSRFASELFSLSLSAVRLTFSSVLLTGAFAVAGVARVCEGEARDGLTASPAGAVVLLAVVGVGVAELGQPLLTMVEVEEDEWES